MMIERHKIDVGFIQIRIPSLREEMKYYRERVRVNPGSLSSLISEAMGLAACLSATESGDAGEIARAVRLAADASVGHFLVAGSPGTPVTFLVEDEEISYSGVIDESIVEPKRWINGIFLNVLVGNADGIQSLCQTPTDLLRRSSTKHPEYRYLVVDALQGFFQDSADCSKRILKAAEAMNPNENSLEWTLYIDVSLAQLLFFIHHGDDGFQDALIEALNLHKKYWSKDKDRRCSWDGLYSLGLTAMSALARDRGMPFVVVSEYTPAGLVDGSAFDP